MTEQSHITIIQPDGTYKHEAIDKLSLDRAQEIVGGYVQRIPMFNRFQIDENNKPVPCVVLADEDGKIKSKPRNNRATLEWIKCSGQHDDCLVGDVVVITGPARLSWG